LTTGVKQEEQRAFDAKTLAKKKDQEIVDKANQVILDKTAKAKIYKDLKKVTFVAQSVKKVKFGEITATSY
jgi:ribosomal protein S25